MMLSITAFSYTPWADIVSEVRIAIRLAIANILFFITVIIW